jgi:peptidyl-prolyl cis-trans isomerase B (cyclophilin B)
MKALLVARWHLLTPGLVLAAIGCYLVLAPISAQRTTPVVVVETSQGTFAFEMFPREAPLSVGHIEKLVRAGFYDGQRVHRAVPGFIVQFGDPQTRDLDKRGVWGRGAEASSGQPVGVAEMSSAHKNVKSAVGLAHMGEPAQADSQLYVLLDTRSELDGQYAVIGQVVEGDEIPARLQAGDQIRRVYVRE